jgi:hypothetical protein
MNDAPLIRMCGMYENVSKDGSTYYAGYLGGVNCSCSRTRRLGRVRHPGPSARPEKGASAAAKPAAEAKSYPQHRNA